MAYWDRISSTKTAAEALQKMSDILKNDLGNAQSPHRLGSQSAEILDESRNAVAELIGCQSSEITFTANGTESNNIALQGLSRAASRKRSGRKIIISAVEHVSIMKTAQQLEKEGFEIKIIPVDSKGRLNRDLYFEALDQNAILVSIQMANPEVGTIQSLPELVKPARDKGVIFHTDAIAGAGWMPVDVNELGVDALSLAGTMFHGPPGAAALYVRRGINLTPLTFGGVQEKNRRPGLENIPAIAGLGIAARIAKSELPTRMEQANRLAKRLYDGLKPIEAIEFTGDLENRIPGHVSVIVDYVEGESLLLMLDLKGVNAASGSSCTAKDLKISPVLMAMGLDHARAQGSLVFSSSRDTAEADADQIIQELPEIVTRLRELSPLWSQRR
jgi:cysteine desulfurase